MLLSNSEFLKELTNLFNSRKIKGSVFLSTKRFTYEPPATTEIAANDGEDSLMQEASGSNINIDINKEKEYPVLIRATDGQEKGSKIKLSTLVQPNHYESFSVAYGLLLKSTMSTSLRKKKKSKLPSTASKKTASLSTPIPSTSTTTTTTAFKFRLPKIIGPMRGAGVKKRVRSIKKREKLKKLFVERLGRREKEVSLFEKLMRSTGETRQSSN